jgi:4-oxalocrotonate tautomerase
VAFTRVARCDGRQKENHMPQITVKLIEGVFNQSQKRQIIEKLTDALVEVEGEPLRPYTQVLIEEIKSGDWSVGGRPLTTQDVKALAGRAASAHSVLT